MARRPNVLWLMSDQHNANCTGFAAHPKDAAFCEWDWAIPGARCRRFARAIFGWYFTGAWMRASCTITAMIRVRSKMFGLIQNMQMCVSICSHN